MAAEATIREAKLAHYLVEAHGKEQELAVALEAHIAMTTKAAYKKRLKEHLRETKSHAKQLERRIKKLDGDAFTTLGKAVNQANKVVAAAKGPLHALRGDGETEKMLKNAKTEYFSEHEEIATYTAIETLATELDDPETAKLARGILREEERMARFLEKQIPILTRQMVKDEIPAAERKAPAKSSRKAPARKTAAKSVAKTAAKGSKKAASKPTAKRSAKPASRKKTSGKK